MSKEPPKEMYWDGLRLQGFDGEYAAFLWDPIHESAIRYVRADQLAAVTAERDKLRAVLGDFVSLANNIEAYGAMKSALDWAKVKFLRDAAQEILALAAEGER